MNRNQFLQEARARISDDPRSRLTPPAKAIINHKDCVIDIHTHIFDRKCLSIRYILLRMAKSFILGSLGLESVDKEMDKMELIGMSEDEIYKDVADKIVDTDEDWTQFEKELEQMIELNEEFEGIGGNLKEATSVLRKRNMLQVLDFYFDHFSITKLNAHSDHKMIAGVLQMDLETGWGITPRRNFKKQIDDIKAISKVRPILPFLAVDPRRAELEGKDENLYELFLNVFTDPETPFFGVKCYPSLGYFPSDARLDPLFEICAEKNIPVLAHCGGESVSTFEKRIKIQTASGLLDFEIPGKSRKLRARFLNEPGQWETVLDKYNNLKLNLGHFGGGRVWLDYAKTGKNPRLEKIFNMMANPDWRVYGDFSYSVIDSSLFDIFKKELENRPEIVNRSLYGTDFWVVLPAGELMEMQERFLETLKDHQTKLLRDNVLDYLLN